ncbi:hypothetical protein LCGC14_2861070 [marine sediment metagenome]|uniref:Uncharacterized protein n=1 Tax=marine sediment metagenome TaxID=412755 RepID=A0A0F8Y5W1_9ZZZZ
MDFWSAFILYGLLVVVLYGLMCGALALVDEFRWWAPFAGVFIVAGGFIVLNGLALGFPLQVFILLMWPSVPEFTAWAVSISTTISVMTFAGVLAGILTNPRSVKGFVSEAWNDVWNSELPSFVRSWGKGSNTHL